VAVFDLQRALTRGFGPADYVGTIPAGLAPVGLAVSPDGRFPREMAPEPGGRTLLVTNFASGQVELVNVAGLP
jgi:DNA-binding beta-propeller fold protein YncE